MAWYHWSLLPGVAGLSARSAGDCLRTAHSFKILPSSEIPSRTYVLAPQVEDTKGFPATWASWAHLSWFWWIQLRYKISSIFVDFGIEAPLWSGLHSAVAVRNGADQIANLGSKCLHKTKHQHGRGMKWYEMIWNVSYIYCMAPYDFYEQLWCNMM